MKYLCLKIIEQKTVHNVFKIIIKNKVLDGNLHGIVFDQHLEQGWATLLALRATLETS